MRESIDIFKIIFEHSAAPTAIFNLDTTIIMANEAYCRVSGLSMDEVIGVSWLTQIPADDIGWLKEFNSERLANSGNAPSEYDFSFYNKQGVRKHGHMFVKLMKEHNLIIASFADTTERRNAELLIDKQREELRQSIVRLNKELAFQALLTVKYNEQISLII